MAKPALRVIAWPHLATVLITVVLGACATVPEPLDAPAPEIVPPDADVGPAPAPIPRLPPQTGPTPLPDPPAVAIVLSGRQAAYESVAAELRARLGDATVYELGESDPSATFHHIGDSGAGAVVAIGLAAARAAVTLASVPVVFCQVFNYRDAGLVTDSSRGVAALAPLEAHLAAWRRANPELRRVGAMLGPGHEALLEEAALAAAQHGVELRVVVVRSDQEAQYHFRRMVNDIDGFWLFPDARILSSRSLREMLMQARRRNVDVAVSNDALLALGADISITTVPADVATTVIDVLRRIEGGRLAELPDVSPLSAAQVVTR